MHRTCPLVACIAALFPAALSAQDWNTADARALVERAVARRAEIRADTGLRDYRARAHGFVFFLGQLGEGLEEPPRLVKSDQLVLEVYWKAPGLSKQRIVGWRDRIDLPTDIRYHRDHLGIVQNNFGNRIRLGHGDEVRDVPHPLAPNGLELYDFAMTRAVTIGLPQQTVRVWEVLVRPKSLDEPRVIGGLFIDVETAELVIFRFSFTRSAYLDDTLEDISIVLENSLWNRRYWLPRRQEIEIRRRTAWLDLPARGIIRGRWEIGEYQLNQGLSDTLFRGQEIVAAPVAVRDTFSWPEPLDIMIRETAGPAMTFDLEEVRAEIGAVAGSHAISGLATARPGVGSVSDILRFNRVEGLAVGAGWLFRPGGGPTAIRTSASYGFGDRRLKGTVSVRYRGGRFSVEVRAARKVTDVGDEIVTAPVLNSLLAQEAGRDYGHYALADIAALTVRRDFGPRRAIVLSLGLERTANMEVVATPARGTFEANPNPPLGAGTYGFFRLRLERRVPELTVRGGVGAEIEIEGGERAGTALPVLAGGPARYLRVRGSTRIQILLGATDLVARGWAGWGSQGLPAYRSFVLGGRGTLVTQGFRALGGRYGALGRLELRRRVPFPALPLGPFLSTGRQIVVAPFVSAGWAGGAMNGMTWEPSTVQPELGVALEWFHRLFRIEWAVNPDGDMGLVLDLGRDLWGIL